MYDIFSYFELFKYKREVAIFKFIKFKNTLIKIGQEWKTKPFDITNISQTTFIDNAYKYAGSKKRFVTAFSKISKEGNASQAISKPY